MVFEALDFSQLIKDKTATFYGREWLYEEFDRFLLSSQGRYFLLSGEPGIGKTSFAAYLVQRDSCLHHFISAQDLDWRSPLAFARSIAAQMIQRFGGWIMSDELAPANFNVNIQVGSVQEGGSVTGVLIEQFVGLSVEEEFRRLVLQPLKRLSGAASAPVSLVIDGLDEAAAYTGAPAIQDLIGRLGSAQSARFLVTANPGPVIDVLYRQLDPVQLVRVDLHGLDANNLADCRLYLEHLVQTDEISSRLESAAVDPAFFIEEALEHSEGNFLYLAYLIDALRQGVSLDYRALPAGLERVYELTLADLASPFDPQWLDMYMPVLGVLAAAPAPLTALELSHLSGLNWEQVRRALHALRSFVDVDEGKPPDQRNYSMYHRAFSRFLFDSSKAGNYWIDPQNMHAKIVTRLLPAGMGMEGVEGEYGLRYIGYHLRHSGRANRDRLLEAVTPRLYSSIRQRAGSNLFFHLLVGEALGAALSLPAADALPHIARLGLIDATLGSRVASLPPGLLAEMAQAGQWQRAAELSRTSASGEAAGLEAVVTGMLSIAPDPPLDEALHVAGQIPAHGEAAYYFVRALARAGGELRLREKPGSDEIFLKAKMAIEDIPEADQQARALAFLTRHASLEPAEQQAWFSDALAYAESMSTELSQDMQDAVMMSNMAAQTAMEAQWNVRRTPFDTQGARVRAMADVAAEMQAAGLQDNAAEIFARAEAESDQISGGFMDDFYRQHSLDYIAARRKAPAFDRLDAPPRPLFELEKDLLAHEKTPVDQNGTYSRVLLKAAQPLAMIGDQRALQIFEQAVASLAEVDGGYKAQLLLEIATLGRGLDQEEFALDLEKQAEQVARSDPGLLEGYQNWLAQTGREHALSLKQVASSRSMIMKGRYFSDQALANLAIALAREDVDDAYVLAEEIQDDLQHARAMAGIAAQAPDSQRPSLIDRVFQFNRVLNEQQKGFLIKEAALAAAPLNRETALQLASRIEVLELRALALVEIAESFDSGQDEAAPVWEEAAQAARQALAQDQTDISSLAYALAMLGKYFASRDQHQAESFWQPALEAARAEKSLALKVSALSALADSLSKTNPERAMAVLEEASRQAQKLEGLRDYSRARGEINALRFSLDEKNALAEQASLRSLGRVNFLDALVKLIPAAVERYGVEMAWRLYLELSEATDFFER
jgi:hypothetical protein